MRQPEKGHKKPPFSPKGSRLPSLDLRGVNLPDVFGRGGPSSTNQKLPNASIVYGVGAGVILAFSLYSLFTGAWFTGAMLLLPAVALLGFALHYLRYPQ